MTYALVNIRATDAAVAKKNRMAHATTKFTPVDGGSTKFDMTPGGGIRPGALLRSGGESMLILLSPKLEPFLRIKGDPLTSYSATSKDKQSAETRTWRKPHTRTSSFSQF